MTRSITRGFLLIFTFLGLIALQACTPTMAERGNMLKQDQIDKVKVGFHKRSDVLRYMGSPTTKSTFDENVWYYIGQETEKHGILDEGVKAESIYAVVFDDQGVVQAVQPIDSERLAIPVSRDKTTTHGNEYTFWQQLLGNMGKFNPPVQQ